MKFRKSHLLFMSIFYAAVHRFKMITLSVMHPRRKFLNSLLRLRRNAPPRWPNFKIFECDINAPYFPSRISFRNTIDKVPKIFYTALEFRRPGFSERLKRGGGLTSFLTCS